MQTYSQALRITNPLSVGVDITIRPAAASRYTVRRQRYERLVFAVLMCCVGVRCVPPRDGLAGVAGVQVIPNKLRLASEESAIVEVQLRANKLPPPKSGASTFARSLACACVRAASASLTPLSSCSWS